MGEFKDKRMKFERSIAGRQIGKKQVCSAEGQKGQRSGED